MLPRAEARGRKTGAINVTVASGGCFETWLNIKLKTLPIGRHAG